MTGGGLSLFTIVPLLFIAVALWTIGRAVWRLAAASRLANGGGRTEGRVVGAHVEESGSNGRNSRVTTRMVETIEFTPDGGGTVRAMPYISDIGMLDRSGTTVTVLYDRSRPERFIAPRNGRKLSPGSSLATLGGSAFFLVVAVIILAISRASLFGGS